MMDGDGLIIEMIRKVGELDAALPPMHCSPHVTRYCATTKPDGLGSTVVMALRVLCDAKLFEPLDIVSALTGLRNIAPELAKVCAQLLTKRDQLQKFKNYVHKRLDEAGVPADPESPHREAGCRIGGRLDEVFAELGRLRERIELAGGYHARTTREIEIAGALYERPEHEWEPYDRAIHELLMLVDAGRNRVHEVEIENEKLRAEVARTHATEHHDIGGSD